jgi:hypothetical protein
MGAGLFMQIETLLFGSATAFAPWSSGLRFFCKMGMKASSATREYFPTISSIFYAFLAK